MAGVKFEVKGKLGIVTLDNQPVNVVGMEEVEELQNILIRIRESGIRALVFRAEGDNFSAGADVNMFKGRTPKEAKDMLETFFKVMREYETLPIPTMAVVQGICLTAGLEAALSMDMIWASDTAVFAQAEALIGAIPFGGGAQRLAARAGSARAKEIVFSAKFYSAEKFLNYNIINRVLPLDELHEKAEKYMAELAENGPTSAFAATKEIIKTLEDKGLFEADEKNREVGAKIFDTEDMKNGVESFLKSGPGNIKFQGK